MLEGTTVNPPEAVNILAEQLGHQPDVTMKRHRPGTGKRIAGGLLGGDAGGPSAPVSIANTKQYHKLPINSNLREDITLGKTRAGGQGDRRQCRAAPDEIRLRRKEKKRRRADQSTGSAGKIRGECNKARGLQVPAAESAVAPQRTPLFRAGTDGEGC
jgi:hypothetical protein